MKHSIPLLGGLMVWLTGCAGYNHTLFMTKSNAGLDFDAKPPTAEITISRKEAVIAPAFEGGQTPPVMASFKPDVGFDGSFGNFFLGVDQTFAGGDAAMAMTTLYGKTTAATDPAQFDSKLDLSKKPKAPMPLLDVAKPGRIRPFIFGTDTMLGLKVAWSGAGGQMPDSLKAGFNRKEFAWAPLMLTNRSPGSNGSQAQWSVKMPSFLATIDSTNKVGTNGNGISALQYFATGAAATRLAMQPDVRAAMLARFDPNKETFKRQFRADRSQQLPRALILVYNGLNDLAAHDPVAAAHLAALNQRASGIEIPASFQAKNLAYYSYIAAINKLERSTQYGDYAQGELFLRVIRYHQDLQGSVDALSTALKQDRDGKTPTLVVDRASQPFSSERATAAGQLEIQLRLLDELTGKIAADEKIMAGFDYYIEQLTK